MGAPLQNVTSNADARPPFHFLPVGSARHRFNKLKREIINVPLYDVYTLFLCAACVSCYFTHKRPRWSEWVGTSVCCNICLMCCCFFSYSFSRGICIHFFFWRVLSKPNSSSYILFPAPHFSVWFICPFIFWLVALHLSLWYITTTTNICGLVAAVTSIDSDVCDALESLRVGVNDDLVPAAIEFQSAAALRSVHLENWISDDEWSCSIC
jgi:hypothetical protein